MCELDLQLFQVTADGSSYRRAAGQSDVDIGSEWGQKMFRVQGNMRDTYYTDSEQKKVKYWIFSVTGA